MSEQDNQALWPVAAGVFTLPAQGDDPVLLGGRCQACDRDFFPRPPRCPYCLGVVEEQSLGGTGRIYSYTVVRVKPPWGLPRPYGVGYVDLDDNGLRVLGLMDPETLDQLEIGLPVRLAVAPMGNNFRGDPCLRPYFQPIDGIGSGHE